MGNFTPICKGFRVVEVVGTGKPKALSRTYHVRAAADEYAALVHKAGHPSAYVESVLGIDDVGFPVEGVPHD